MRRITRERAVVGASATGAFLVGVLAHWESLTYWFTASDTVPMIESSRVSGSGDLLGVLTEPMLAGTRFVEFALFYRPLASLTYAVDYRLWGLDPWGFHLTTVLLHGVAAALATVAIYAVTRRPTAGSFGGLLFAGHPLTAEVVPSAVRRHDVLLTIFLLAALVLLVRSRRAREVPSGRGALAGSLACYGLALASKEPALVFPGVVVAWAALEEGRPWARESLSAAARAVAPFLAVTLAYIAVRVAVLGELGGYERNPVPSPADAVTILVEYPLSLGYPHAVVGMGTLPGAGFRWRLFVAGMGLVGGVVLAASGLTVRRRGLAVPSVAAAVTGAALVAVPLSITSEPWLVSTVPVVYDPGELSIVRAYLRPSSAVVGLLLVTAVAAAAVWAATDRSSLRATDGRALAFFGLWLVGPVVLFFPSGNYTFRGGYASLVPAMGALGLLLAVGVDGLPSAVRRTAEPPPEGPHPADVALVGVALILVVPLVATSPLLAGYDGWATSGRVNEATLTGVETATDGAPPGAAVTVEGMLRIVADRGCSFPQSKTVQFARPGTVEGWLRLHGEDRRVSSRDDRILQGEPGRVRVTGGIDGGNVTTTVHYGDVAPGSCVRTPWER